MALLHSILDVQRCHPGLPGLVCSNAIVRTANAMFTCRSAFTLEHRLNKVEREDGKMRTLEWLGGYCPHGAAVTEWVSL